MKIGMTVLVCATVALSLGSTRAAQAADGRGSLVAWQSAVSASSTVAKTVFTYAPPSAGVTNGAISIVVPTGWTAPTVAKVTSTAGSVSVSARTITVSGLTLAGGENANITFSGATAPAALGAQTWTAKQKSTAGGTLTDLPQSPSIDVVAPDGTGTVQMSGPTVVPANYPATFQFTYTAPAGGIENGMLQLCHEGPTNWSSPSTTPSARGYMTTTAGTLDVATPGCPRVGNLTLAAGDSVVISYGSRAGGGPGAIATGYGSSLWEILEKSSPTGTRHNAFASPGQVVAADGSGHVTTTTGAVARSSSGLTVQFDLETPDGGISNGSVTLAVPSGWSAPSTTTSAPGYVTASAGHVSVANRTITISGLTMTYSDYSYSAPLTITYGSRVHGGPGASAPATVGTSSWTASEQSIATSNLVPTAHSPAIDVVAEDGSGSLTGNPSQVGKSATHTTISFTYTAAAGGIEDGAVTLTVPTGWSAPSKTQTAPGFTSTSAGQYQIAGRVITVSHLQLSAGQTFSITYGQTNKGGPGATAPSSNGSQTWATAEQSATAGTPQAIASSPVIRVGTGTLQTSLSVVTPSRHGQTVQLSFTPAGALTNGVVTVAVPTGWSAPSITTSAAGYTSATAGQVSVSGRTITVSELTRSQPFTITYGDRRKGGPGATSPATLGSGTWSAYEKDTASGTRLALDESPTTVVVSPDGSGTLTTTTSTCRGGATGQTITFKFTAAAGGIVSGQVTLTVPTGWSTPSTSGTAAGYVTTSAGHPAISGRTIVVTGVTLPAGQTLTIVYGQRKNGGPGATAPKTTGSQTWAAQEESTVAGPPVALASSPVIKIS